jgi:hypothetical protein
MITAVYSGLQWPGKYNQHWVVTSVLKQENTIEEHSENINQKIHEKETGSHTLL